MCRIIKIKIPTLEPPSAHSFFPPKTAFSTYGLAPSSNCKNVDTISSNKTSPSYTYLRISLDHTLPRPTKPLLHISLQYWQRRGD